MTVGECMGMVEALAPVCRKHGIKRVAVSADGVEMEFEAPTSQVSEDVMAKFAQQLEQSMPSEEEILYHSAPGMPMRAEEGEA